MMSGLLLFTRYNKDSPLKNNEDFLSLFGWLIRPMSIRLLEAVRNYLISGVNKDKKSVKVT